VGQSVIQPSFAAGEVSPSLYGRVDLAKYRTGLALCRNFFIDYRGGVVNRTGSKFVGQALNSSNVVWLIPFNFNAEQTYMLEFGQQTMRVIMDGGYVLDADLDIISIGSTGNTETTTPHGFVGGEQVFYSNIPGVPQLDNGTFFVSSIITATRFSIVGLSGSPVSIPGGYVGPGNVGSIYSTTTPYNAEDLPLIKFAQSNDVMTLTHPLYGPRDLIRTAHNSWSFNSINFGSVEIDPPTNLSGTASTAGTVQFGYVVTAVSDSTGEESLPSVRELVDSVNIATTSGSIALEWDPVEGAAYYNVYKAQVTPGTDIQTGAAYGYVGTAYGATFTDGNIVADYTRTPPLQYNPFAQRPITDVEVLTGGTLHDDTTTIVFGLVGSGTGAAAVPIIQGGVIVDVLLTNRGQNYSLNTTAATGGAGSGATFDVHVGAQEGNFPGVVCYFQQRKVFLSTTNAPSTLWATRPGAYSNMDYSNPTNDGDSLELPLYSLQANPIKSAVPMPGGLVIFTASGAWQLSGGQPNVAITPSNAIATPQAYNGANYLQPIVIGPEILYVQDKGAIVRNLSYNFFSNIYTGQDMSVLAAHLFTYHQIVSWTYAEEPFKLVWAVREDGSLLSFTFLKEQEVYAWARHDTQGLYKCVATIQEGTEDVVYAVVERTVGGAPVKFIERFASREMPNGVEDGWFLDSALEYPLVYPSGTMSVSAISGEVTLTGTGSAFDSGSVGSILRIDGGKIEITEVAGPDNATGTVLQTLTEITYVTNSEGGWTAVPKVSDEGEWSLTAPITDVAGLDHLEGSYVYALADGGVQGPFIVTDGSITLSVAASRIIIGLSYQGQVQTLDLDVGDPTIQGKRKKINALTTRVLQTRGLKYGVTFDSLTEFKMQNTFIPLNEPIPFQTGDQRLILGPAWTTEGRLCFQQDYPLPATILAVIPEVAVGDNAG